MKLSTMIIVFIFFAAGILVGERITATAYQTVFDARWKNEEQKMERGIRTVLRLAMCESSFRPNAVGDGGKSRGLLQYQKPTFADHSAWSGRSDLEWLNAEDQFVLALWAVRNGHGPAWTCWKEASYDIAF